MQLCDSLSTLATSLGTLELFADHDIINGPYQI